MAIARIVMLGCLAIVSALYLAAWKSKAVWTRTAASIIVASLLLIVTWVGTVAYAIPSLDDLTNPAVPKWFAILGNCVLWLICLSGWFIGGKMVIQALRSSLKIGRSPQHDRPA